MVFDRLLISRESISFFLQFLYFTYVSPIYLIELNVQTFILFCFCVYIIWSCFKHRSLSIIFFNDFSCFTCVYVYFSIIIYCLIFFSPACDQLNGNWKRNVFGSFVLSLCMIWFWKWSFDKGHMPNFKMCNTIEYL